MQKGSCYNPRVNYLYEYFIRCFFFLIFLLQTHRLVLCNTRCSCQRRYLFRRKCRNNEAAYPAFGLESTMKLGHLTAHWTWPGLSRAISGIKVDLKGLEILTPNLRQRLQDLLHACGLNITAYRITVIIELVY